MCDVENRFESGLFFLVALDKEKKKGRIAISPRLAARAAPLLPDERPHPAPAQGQPSFSDRARRTLATSVQLFSSVVLDQSALFSNSSTLCKLLQDNIVI